MSKSGGYTGPLEQVGPCQWRIPKSYREDMRVDGLIFADESLIAQIKKDQGPEQVVNVVLLVAGTILLLVSVLMVKAESTELRGRGGRG